MRRHNAQKGLKKEVVIRDVVCRACGSNGHHIHHIVLASNEKEWEKITEQGKELDYLIFLCRKCHDSCPDVKSLDDTKGWEEFKKYINNGGSALPQIIGKAIMEAEKQDLEIYKEWPRIKKIVRIWQNTCFNFSLEQIKEDQIPLKKIIFDWEDKTKNKAEKKSK